MFGFIKNVIEKIGMAFSRLFERDLFVKIASLVAAVVIWFTISVSVYPTIETVVYNVPVEIGLEGTYADANGFQVMSKNVETVTVYIRGNRGQIGNITSEELKAVATADNVMYAMDYNMLLNVECTTGKEFEVIKVDPPIVNVDFDKFVTKEVPVNPELSGINAAEGYVMGGDEGIAVVPDKVSITGPARVVDNITSAAAVVSEDTSLTATTDFTTTSLKLYSGTSVIDVGDKENLAYSKPDFTIHVPVFGKRTVKLDVRISNAPASFDTEKFKEQLVFSVDELEIAIPGESSMEIEYLEVGTIDMREFDIGKEFTFDTEAFLPEGCQDWNEVRSVTVKYYDSDSLIRRSIHITNSAIELVNAPSKYDFKIVTSGVTPIFIGPAESMAQLSYIDVIAQIDMLNGFDAEQDFHKLPVTFSIPAHSDIWCIGSEGALSPRATIQVTAKDEDR